MLQLQIKDLNKRYQNKSILTELNLNFDQNQIYGLLGRNGVGKSTLLNIMSNRIFASQGQIYWHDKLLKGKDHPIRGLYLMSEQTLFNQNERLSQIIKNTRLLQGSLDEELLHEMTAEFGLNLKNKFSQLSTGYRTIFKVILALCVPAEMLCLDEPVLGLDANHRQMVYRYVLTAYERQPRTVIIATHIIEEIEHLVNQVIILNDARVLENAPTEQILAKSYAISGPAPVVEAYCQGLKILKRQEFGNLLRADIYAQLPQDRDLPDSVTVEHNDLQTTFINLTDQEEYTNV